MTNRAQANRVNSFQPVIICFIFILVLNAGNAQGETSELCVRSDLARYYYDVGRRAVELEDWVTAYGLTTYVYLITKDSSNLSRMEDFRAEVLKANDKLKNKLRDIISENVKLRAQVEQLLAAQHSNGTGVSYQGITSKEPAPYLRPNPPF